MAKKKLLNDLKIGQKYLFTDSSLSACGYTSIVPTPQLKWEIVHNKNTKNIIYQIYDDTGLKITPSSVSYTNNSFIIQFSSPFEGKINYIVNSGDNC